MKKIKGFIREVRKYYSIKRRYKNLVKEYELDNLRTISDPTYKGLGRDTKDKMQIEIKRLCRTLINVYDDYKTIIEI